MERTKDILSKISYLYEQYPDDWFNRSLMLFDDSRLESKMKKAYEHGVDNKLSKDVLFSGVYKIVEMYYVEPKTD